MVQSIDILNGAKRVREGRVMEEWEADRGERLYDDIKDDPRFSMVKANPDKGIEAANPGGSFEALMGGAWMSMSHGPAFNTTSFKPDSEND